MMNKSGSDAKANKRLIDEITFFIPDFKGYKEKEIRRTSDKLVRESIVNNLEKAEREFREALSLLSTPVSGDIMTLIDIINYRISRLRDIIKMKRESYSRFFDYIKVEETLLDKLMTYDLKLLRISRKVSDDIATFSKKGFTGLDIRNRLMMIIEALKVLEGSWNERLKLLKDYK